MISYLVPALVYGVILGFSELLRKTTTLSTEATRRSAHILSGVYTLFLPLLVDLTGVLIITGGFFVVLLITKRKHWFQSIHQVRRTTYGAIAYPLGVAGTALLTLPDHLNAYLYAILVLTFADSMAGLLGTSKRIQRGQPLWHGIRGSFIFWLMSTAAALCMLLTASGQSFSVTLLAIPICLTLMERYSPLGFDNLTVPVTAAALWMIVT